MIDTARMYVPALKRKCFPFSQVCRHSAPDRRHPVGRQLHDERGRLAAEQRLLEDDAHRDREHDPDDVERPDHRARRGSGKNTPTKST